MVSRQVARPARTRARCDIASIAPRDIRSFRSELDEYMDSGGYLAWSVRTRTYSLLGTRSPRLGLVRCPSCGTGMLMLVRSRTTRKRFIGCSNYLNGCDASSPLLQRARLRALKQACTTCSWPIVIYRYSRKAKWQRMCSNRTCSSSN